MILPQPHTGQENVMRMLYRFLYTVHVECRGISDALQEKHLDSAAVF